jgi:hypothetical protein
VDPIEPKHLLVASAKAGVQAGGTSLALDSGLRRNDEDAS